MNIEALVRDNIRRLRPYRTARQDSKTGILLDANENRFGSVWQDGTDQLNQYPDPFQRELRERLAHLEGTSPSSVFTGVGSDEVIDLLLRVFCEPRRDHILIIEPTYGMYAVSASIQDVVADNVQLDESFHLDLPATRSAIRPSTKLVFCCSPNNPTGNLLRRDDIRALCALTTSLVIVDEAYIDFARTRSLATDVHDTPNMVIVKTLSKSWGLAGIRLGYCVAHPDVVSYLDKVKPPYNINSLTGRVALAAVANSARRDELVASIVGERHRLEQELPRYSFIERVYPSDSNFLLLRCSDHRPVLTYLRKRGIVVRDRSSQPGLERCLRITVGTVEENTLLLSALRDMET